jgi:hypothetical protein
MINKIICPSERYARRCDVTGKGINEGYVFCDGVFYCSTEEQALAEVKKDGYDTLEQAYEDDFYYYTEWEEIDYDDTYYDEHGNEYVSVLKAIEHRIKQGYYYVLASRRKHFIDLYMKGDNVEVSYAIKSNEQDTKIFEYDIIYGLGDFIELTSGFFTEIVDDPKEVAYLLYERDDKAMINYDLPERE